MKMVNLPVCDLRNIKTAEAARKIEEITNCALVIMPQDGDDELLTALASIPQTNVASTVSLPANADVSLRNGVTTLTAGMMSSDKETYYLINGITVVESIPADKKGTLIANGVIVLHEKNRAECGLKFGTVNGITAYADFENTVVQDDSFEIDADFLKYVKPKTLLIAGDSIDIAEDVAVDELAEKISFMLAGDKIVCPKAVSGYVRANSTCGDGIELK